LSCEANPFPYGDQLFSCAGWNTPFAANVSARTMLQNGGTLVWDNQHVGEYIHGTAQRSQSFNNTTINAGDRFIIPVMSNRNLDSVVAWGRAKGYTNFGLYDVSTDAEPTATDKMPLHNHLSALMGGGAPPPPPPPGPTGTFTASPTSLPAGGGNVTLAWTSSNATSASIDQGIGSVSLNGSRSVAVTSTR